MSAINNIIFTDQDWHNKISIVDTARIRVKVEDGNFRNFIAPRFKLGTSVGMIDCLLPPDKLFDLVSDTQIDGLMGPMTPKLSGFKLLNSSDELDNALTRIDIKWIGDDSLYTTAEKFLKMKLRSTPTTFKSPRALGKPVKKFSLTSPESQMLRENGGWLDHNKDYVKITGASADKEYWALAFDHDPYYLPKFTSSYKEVLWFSKNAEGDVDEYELTSESFTADLKSNRIKLGTALNVANEKFIELLKYEGEGGSDFNYLKSRIIQEAKDRITPLACKKWATSGGTGGETLESVDVDAYIQSHYQAAKTMAATVITKNKAIPKYLGPNKASSPRYLGELVMVERPYRDEFKLSSPHHWFELQCIMMSIFASTYEILTTAAGTSSVEYKTHVERTTSYNVYNLLNSSASFVERGMVTGFSYVNPTSSTRWQGSGSLVKYKANSGENYSITELDEGLPDVVEELYETLEGDSVTLLAMANTFRHKPEYINPLGKLTDDEVGWILNPKLIEVAGFLDEYKLYDYASSESNSVALGAAYHNYAKAFTVKSSNWVMRKIISAIGSRVGAFDTEQTGRDQLKQMSEGVDKSGAVRRISKKEITAIWEKEIRDKMSGRIGW
jgi:hypothetical protein